MRGVCGTNVTEKKYYRNLVGKHKGKKWLGRLRRIGEYNIKTDRKEMGR
jgi:hypothetical protein